MRLPVRENVDDEMSFGIFLSLPLPLLAVFGRNRELWRASTERICQP